MYTIGEIRMLDEILELRHLTENEKQDFDHIVYSEEELEPAAQILFGLVAIDLLNEEEKKESVPYSKLMQVNGISPECDGIAGIWEIFRGWIRKTMTYNELGFIRDLPENTRGLQRNLDGVITVLTTYVCEIGYDMSSKKERLLGRTFEAVDEKLQEEQGITLRQHPEMIMRFILSALEAFGFYRKKDSVETQFINTSEIGYEDYA